MADRRINERAAGYVELPGATKDGDCEAVEVAGGISRKLGCCNLFDPENAAQLFNCGSCEYVIGEPDQGSDSTKPLTKDSSKGMSFKEILESQRPVEGKQ
jgi:hypothetical protein